MSRMFRTCQRLRIDDGGGFAAYATRNLLRDDDGDSSERATATDRAREGGHAKRRQLSEGRRERGRTRTTRR